MHKGDNRALLAAPCRQAVIPAVEATVFVSSGGPGRLTQGSAKPWVSSSDPPGPLDSGALVVTCAEAAQGAKWAAVGKGDISGPISARDRSGSIGLDPRDGLQERELLLIRLELPENIPIEFCNLPLAESHVRQRLLYQERG